MQNKVSFTTIEAAKYLGISTSTIYRMEKKGLVTSIRTPGGQRRFDKEIIENYKQQSIHIEAPQNPNKFKQNIAYIKETTTEYSDTSKKANLYELRTRDIVSPYFDKDNLTIYNEDFIGKDFIEKKSIDLIVTSPPYNVDIKYNSHNDTVSYEEYLHFTDEWLAKSYELLKDDGRFCLNIPLDKNKNGQQSVYSDITAIAKKIGFKYHSTIIWNEQNISRRTAWGSWLSAAAPYVIAPVEVIVILYKQYWKKSSGSRKSDITKKEFLEWTNGVWNFSGESKKRIGHPAPFPIELPYRCIKLFTYVGDKVLDPFLGSGTSILACLKTRRVGIGVEIDEKYCALAQERLSAEGKINQYALSR